MAATVKTRIQLKNDTEAHWALATNFCPLKGELIIYSADDAHPFCRLKVGDGITPVTDLSFITADSDYIYFKTTAEWAEHAQEIPEANTILVYTDGATVSNVTVPRIKIADGSTYLIDLPFLGDEILVPLNAHINNNVVHTSAAEREYWNNKLNCNNYVLGETLILNRN